MNNLPYFYFFKPQPTIFADDVLPNEFVVLWPEGSGYTYYVI